MRPEDTVSLRDVPDLSVFFPSSGSCSAGHTSFSLLKADCSATVGILKAGDFGLHTDLWVKQFHPRGIFRFLFEMFFGSKVKRLWRVTLLLFQHGFPVPEPVGYLRPSLRRRSSYFAARVIENSDNLGNYFKKGLVSEPGELAKSLGGTLAYWHSSGAVHGDLKWSNILIRKEAGGFRFFLVDLDRAKLLPAPSVRRITKDLVRFYRYSLELGVQEWVDSLFFPAYLSGLADDLKSKIGLSEIRTMAQEEWTRKGKRILRKE